MKLSQPSPFPSLLTAATICGSFLLQGVLAQGPAYPVAYCSSLNTATGEGLPDIYQSEGECYNNCISSYAFAVLKGNTCWCSNYIPGTTTSTSSCQEACPGFPTDYCGNSVTNLYGYVRLAKNPSGTIGAAASSTVQSTSAAAVQSTSAAAVQSTSAAAVQLPTSQAVGVATTTQQQTTAAPVTSFSTSTTPAPQPTSVTASSPASVPVPIVSVETVNGGGIRTVTVTPSSQPTSNSQASLISPTPNSRDSGGGGGLSTGGAVGLTVGLVALVALIGAIVFCCIRRRRKQDADHAAAAYEEVTPRGSSAGGPPQRTMSENSRYMLGTDGSHVVEAWQEDGSGNRRSRLMPVDPRLDPFAPVYQRGDANKSRESVATINDGHDYSRRMLNGKGPLRAVNV